MCHNDKCNIFPKIVMIYLHLALYNNQICQ